MSHREHITSPLTNFPQMRKCLFLPCASWTKIYRGNKEINACCITRTIITLWMSVRVLFVSAHFQFTIWFFLEKKYESKSEIIRCLFLCFRAFPERNQKSPSIFVPGTCPIGHFITLGVHSFLASLRVSHNAVQSEARKDLRGMCVCVCICCIFVSSRTSQQSWGTVLRILPSGLINWTSLFADLPHSAVPVSTAVETFRPQVPTVTPRTVYKQQVGLTYRLSFCSLWHEKSQI